MQTEALRAFRFTLDPTRVREEVLLRHVGAARWVFNHVLGMKVAAHQEWWAEGQADLPAPSGMTPLIPQTWCASCRAWSGRLRWCVSFWPGVALGVCDSGRDCCGA
ncbi:helix-turn-helix domain-containing protein, partial [Streptomyces sp. NPDC004044]